MAALMVAGIEETLYYYAFPREHWDSLRTNRRQSLRPPLVNKGQHL